MKSGKITALLLLSLALSFILSSIAYAQTEIGSSSVVTPSVSVVSSVTTVNGSTLVVSKPTTTVQPSVRMANSSLIYYSGVSLVTGKAVSDATRRNVRLPPTNVIPGVMPGIRMTRRAVGYKTNVTPPVRVPRNPYLPKTVSGVKYKQGYNTSTAAPREPTPRRPVTYTNATRKIIAPRPYAPLPGVRPDVSVTGWAGYTTVPEQRSPYLPQSVPGVMISSGNLGPSPYAQRNPLTRPPKLRSPAPITNLSRLY